MREGILETCSNEHGPKRYLYFPTCVFNHYNAMFPNTPKVANEEPCRLCLVPLKRNVHQTTNLFPQKKKENALQTPEIASDDLCRPATSKLRPSPMQKYVTVWVLAMFRPSATGESFGLLRGSWRW